MTAESTKRSTGIRSQDEYPFFFSEETIIIKYLDPIGILKRIIPYNNAIHFILGSLTFIPILLLLKLLRVSPIGIVLYGFTIISILAVYGHAREPAEKADSAYNKDDIVYILLGSISSIIAFIISSMKI